MPFFAIGSLSILNLVAIILILPNIKGHLEKARTINPFTAMLNLLKQPNLQKAILFMLLLVLGQFIIIPFITPYNIRNVGLLQSEVPYIYTIGGIVSIFNAPLVGRLSDKFGRKPLFFIFAIYSIIPLLWITNMQPSPLSVILISAGALFLGIGGRMIPAQTLMTQLVEPQNRGAFMSLNSSIQQLGAGLGAYIAGLIIIDTTNGKLQNYDIVGYLAVGFTILAILLFTRIKSLE
jgi:predicted MFS family arabinose efflux permease